MYMNSAIEHVSKFIDGEELTRLTYELVKISSETLHELEASKFYAKILEEMGLETRLDYSVAEDRPNVIGRLKGSGGGKSLLFCGHIDTIPIGDCVSPKIDKEKVYGRGSQDQKGGLACQAEMVKALIRSGVKLKGDIWLVAWVGHETPDGRGEGPRVIARAVREGGITADAAVNTEGPLDTIIICQGGMADFTVKVSGPKVSHHSTTSPLTSNPILWTGELIEELGSYDEELNSKEWHPCIQQRPHLQLGIVKGGDFFNRVPKAVEITGNVRWDPGQTVDDVTHALNVRLRRLQRDLRKKYDGSVTLDLGVRLAREAAEISPDEEIVEKAQKAVGLVLQREVPVAGMRAVGDFSIMNIEGGIPTIYLGPYLSWTLRTSHSDIEHVERKSLEAAAKTYLSLALNYCQTT